MLNKKKKQFLKLPKLEGGNSDFQKFIDKHLQYPEEALKNKIEGIVHLSYDVDDYGNIFNLKIKKGLGYGCDEEAMRLIKMQKFSKVTNQGVRIKISQKAKIIFKIKVTEVVLNYSYKEQEPTSANEDTPSSETSVTWSIKL